MYRHVHDQLDLDFHVERLRLIATGVGDALSMCEDITIT